LKRDRTLENALDMLRKVKSNMEMQQSKGIIIEDSEIPLTAINKEQLHNQLLDSPQKSTDDRISKPMLREVVESNCKVKLKETNEINLGDIVSSNINYHFNVNKDNLNPILNKKSNINFHYDNFE